MADLIHISHIKFETGVEMRKISDSFFSSREWLELRYATLRRYGFKCMACQASGEMHIDHIKPRSLFPELELDPENVQVLCRDCNLGKSNRYADDFRSEAKLVNIKVIKRVDPREWGIATPSQMDRRTRRKLTRQMVDLVSYLSQVANLSFNEEYKHRITKRQNEARKIWGVLSSARDKGAFPARVEIRLDNLYSRYGKILDPHYVGPRAPVKPILRRCGDRLK